MNKFMKQGIFPDSIKIGKITPIYKKDNPELLENYRLVSTLPIFEKIFEKMYMKDLIITLYRRDFVGPLAR